MTISSSADELAELRGAVRDFLSAKSGEHQVRSAIETQRGYDDALWEQMAGQLSLPALALPAQYGGDGFSFVELQVVLGEMGRFLVPGPFLPSVVLAAGAILAVGDDAAARAHLPGIASGKTTATLAVAEATGEWSFDRLSASAWPGDGGWLVSGTKQFVLHGGTADLIVVAAHTGQGPGFFAVGGDAPGLTRTALRTLDLTRPMATLRLEAVPATLIGAAGAAGPALESVLSRWNWPRRPPPRPRAPCPARRTPRRRPWPRRWRTRSAPSPSCSLPWRTSRYTAGSGSPGSTRPICTSAAQSPRS